MKNLNINIKEILQSHFGENLSKVKSLGLREDGKIIRKQIEKIIEDGKSDIITIDFGGLDIVSHAFADELFGELIEKYGWEFVKNNIKPININSSIKEVLKTVVVFRFWKKENLGKQNK
jgi:anti-anti-sigma regulatory factor